MLVPNISFQYAPLVARCHEYVTTTGNLYEYHCCQGETRRGDCSRRRIAKTGPLTSGRSLFDPRNKFMLYHADGRLGIWCNQSESMDPSCLVSTVKAGGGYVMVWRLFSWNNLGTLITMDHRLNGPAYLNNVADQVHTFMSIVHPAGDGYFQQDYAPCIKTSVVCNRFAEHESECWLLPWPAQSPDLNPMEHMLDEVERAVRGMPVQPSNVQQLRDAVMSA